MLELCDVPVSSLTLGTSFSQPSISGEFWLVGRSKDSQVFFTFTFAPSSSFGIGAVELATNVAPGQTKPAFLQELPQFSD